MTGSIEPASLRERKKTRTRAALVAAALELFEERGYDETTIDDIAAAADVSPRTFFRYFATKEEVAQGDDLIEEVMELISGRPADEAVIESFRRVTADSFALVSEFDRAALLARLRLIYHTPSLRARRWEQFHELARISAAMIAERLGLPPNDLGARVTAAAGLSAVEVAIEHWAQGDGQDDLGETLDAAIVHLGDAFGD